MIFCNVGWMNRYAGRRGDSIRGGGAYVEQNKDGGEIYNFAAHRRRLYGYVQATHGGGIDLQRIGASGERAFIDDVTVAWVAKHPSGGLRLVGWYLGARVFRTYQPAPRSARRQNTSYLFMAKASNSMLVEPDARTLAIPRNRKGAMGQSNVWYADSPIGKATVRKVKQFIAAVHGDRTTTRRSSHNTSDTEKKARVERAAIRVVASEFERLGYRVASVELQNLGWDLVATRGSEQLQIEVKGLSGSGSVVELTPNEYAMMAKHHKTYRVCVVSNALDRRRCSLRKFSSLDKHRWIDEHDQVLHIDERTGARLSWT
jgi:hypothetical protein